jgi:uncharacterized protein (DUF4415 family)
MEDRMPDLTKLSPKQTAQYTYMMDVMRRLEWDLHHRIEDTGRIPPEWHEIAQARPRAAKVKVNLLLEEDVVKFFRSLGPGYGPRINDVLKSFVHARLAGVIRGAETLNLYREASEVHDGPKPGFGVTAKAMGEAWEDAAPPPLTREAKMQRLVELRAARDAAEAAAGPKGGGTSPGGAKA